MECDPCIWKRSMSDRKYMESVLYRLFHELMEHCSISVGKKLLEWPYGTVWNGQFWNFEGKSKFISMGFHFFGVACKFPEYRWWYCHKNIFILYLDYATVLWSTSKRWNEASNLGMESLCVSWGRCCSDVTRHDQWRAACCDKEMGSYPAKQTHGQAGIEESSCSSWYDDKSSPVQRRETWCRQKSRVNLWIRARKEAVALQTSACGLKK